MILFLTIFLVIFVKIIKLDIAACQVFTTYYIKNYQLCLEYNSLTHSTKFYSGSQYVSHGRSTSEVNN